MNTLQNSLRFGFVALALVSFFVLAVQQVHAEDGLGCDFCGGDYGYTYYESTSAPTPAPDYGYTYYEPNPTPAPTPAPDYGYTYYEPNATPSTSGLTQDATSLTQDATSLTQDASSIYSAYNIYSGYPYSYGGYNSAFNFGLFYSNVGTPTYVNPIVYSSPIVYQTPVYQSPTVYSTPTYYTQPSYSYVTPVTQSVPTYNVQAYVPPTNYNYSYSYPTPSCSITSNNSYGNNYNYGVGQAMLSWTSYNANSGYITPSVGAVSTTGTATVYPSGTQTYVLTVNGSGGSATCQTSVTGYTAPVQAPAAPYVALTQIPYTGIDFGPVGDAMYWLALILFAVAGAYLVVYYIPGHRIGITGLTNEVFGEPEMLATASTGNQTRAEPVVKHTEPSATPNSYRAFGTSDAMTVERSKKGDAPRIVIVRN